MNKHRPIGTSKPGELDDSDKLQRFVRVREITKSGLVEFDFAIGSPDLFVELLLPQTAFDEFCEKNQVSFMTDEQCELVDTEMKKWRYGEEALLNKHNPNIKNTQE